jgi:acetyl esterase/lipase
VFVCFVLQPIAFAAAGDSAGGNLVLAALAYLRDGAGKSSSSTGDSAPAPAPALARKSGDGASSSKRRSSGGGSKRSSGAAGAAADASAAAAKHSWQPPAAAVLISPAVDLSSKSVFGPALARHFRQRKEQQQLEEQRALERQQRRQRQKQQQQQQQQQEQQGEEAEQAGSGDAAGAQEQAPRQQPRGPSLPLRSGQQQEAQGPVQLLSGKVVLPRVSQAADACVDYVCTGEGIAAADLYVRADEPAQLLDPLVSPLQLASFGGLVEKEWLVVWGAVEMMAPDIARLVAKMQQDPAGVAVQAHVGELRVHAFPVLTYSRRLMEEGAAAIVPFIVDVVLEEGDYVRV